MVGGMTTWNWHGKGESWWPEGVNPSGQKVEDSMAMTSRVEKVEKVERRQEGWQSRVLSRRGCLVLLQSALSAMPIFYLLAFKMYVLECEICMHVHFDTTFEP